jgi:uncharacterized protein
MMNKKTIFITGATSGIGLKMAQLCIEKGYEVYATGRNDASLQTLSNLGAHAIKADLRKKYELDYVLAQLPPLDVVILNAGLGIFNNAFDLTDEQVDEMFDVNVHAPIYLARKLAPKLIEQKHGHFIIISSQAGKVATKKASIYASTKHALTGFINGFRLELAQYNVKVTGIYPGPIDTPFLHKADAQGAYREAIKNFLILPDTVAKEVVRTIERPVREVNLPRVMGLTAKLYAIAPSLVEAVGKGFFNKK